MAAKLAIIANYPNFLYLCNIIIANHESEIDYIRCGGCGMRRDSRRMHINDSKRLPFGHGTSPPVETP